MPLENSRKSHEQNSFVDGPIKWIFLLLQTKQGILISILDTELLYIALAILELII